MKTAHLITAARRALTTLRASEETVHTLTITTTHDPARHTLAYNSESVTARHNDSTVAYIDFSDTEFAEDVDAYAENALATSGDLRPLTLRLGAGPTTPPPAELSHQTRLFILSIHARSAAHRPDLTSSQVLALANLAYETNDVARQDTTPTRRQIESYAQQATAHELPFGPEASRVPHADCPPGGTHHEPLHAALPARHRGACRSSRRDPCLARPPGRSALPRRRDKP
ncbi:hypothetical protein ACIQGT_36785 [Streptomyces sp. NPDC093108]|uniref:hypothetical protein n=1 Tax=Streptomyces sp. NPDC093108 TaxID=3366030 RepID=UPI0038228D13